MRKFGWIAILAALSAAAGCGGNGSPSFATLSSSSSSSGTTAKVAAVSVITSLPQIPSNGSANATITAFVRDANNAFIAGVPVVFSATSGGLAVTTATSNASGQAIATLDTAGDPTVRSITVTATAGTQSAKITVGVVGTTVALSGPASLIQGAMGTYTVSLTDSAGAPIPNEAVAVASSAGNTLSAATLITDTSGHATFTVTGSKAGADTLTATVLGQSATASLSVSNQNFAFTVPAANAFIALSTTQTVTVVWSTGGVAQAGQVVTFSTTRGTFNGSATATTATATTDGTGTASVTIAATTAGPAIITASASGVSAQLPVTFVATDPSAIDLQASPGTVKTQGQSTITAIVRDPSNNLVEGQTVSFQLTDVTGGSLSVGSAVTDVQGKAQTVYTASGTSSATNGVKITASIPAVPAVPVATVTLTVGGQTVFLSLGTGNTISTDPTNTQFIMPFIVQAQDAAGNAVNGVTITLAIRSLQYRKGGYVVYNSAWVQTGAPQGAPYTTTAPPGTVVCANEDVNGTGIYEASEDINNNGKLDPGNVAAVSPGTVVTGPTSITTGTTTTTINGAAALTVTYPQDHALWVQSLLTASATVAGTETTATSTFWLPILATDLTTVTQSPPGIESPYGDDAADPPNFALGTGGCLNPD
ncbi:MAG: beta strand repeat-containing protein [Steroidobacterales bacterium]